MFDKPELGSLDWAIRTDGLVTSRHIGVAKSIRLNTSGVGVTMAAMMKITRME